MADVVVIGGGVIGMMSAHALRLAGADVMLIERGVFGGESSWAGGGILSALVPWEADTAVNRLILWGQRHYHAIAEALAQQSGIDPQWLQSGMVVVGDRHRALAPPWSAASGFALETLEVRQLEALVPNLVVTESACHLPQIAQIRNPRLIKALHHSLTQLGVDLRERCEVAGFEKHQGRLTAVKTRSGDIAADRFVLTAGAWSGTLLAEPLLERIKPIRGQMLLYRASADLLTHIVVSDECYLVPRQDGHILVGSTVEDVGFDRSTTMSALQHLSRCAQRLLPVLAEVPLVGHWSGLRPGGGNGVPLIGRLAPYDNLFVNSGHFRNGIAMAPASAQLLVDVMLQRTPSIDPQPYQPR